MLRVYVLILSAFVLPVINLSVIMLTVVAPTNHSDKKKVDKRNNYVTIKLAYLMKQTNICCAVEQAILLLFYHKWFTLSMTSFFIQA